MTQKQHKVLKWTTRILSLAVLLFFLPFYFGYGNPLPFMNSNYTGWDNMWLSIFPLMLVGLALGWKYERIGGLLAAVPVAVGMILSVVIFRDSDFGVHMFVPLVLGIMYLIVGCKKLAPSPKENLQN